MSYIQGVYTFVYLPIASERGSRVFIVGSVTDKMRSINILCTISIQNISTVTK